MILFDSLIYLVVWVGTSHNLLPLLCALSLWVRGYWNSNYM